MEGCCGSGGSGCGALGHGSTAGCQCLACAVDESGGLCATMNGCSTCALVGRTRSKQASAVQARGMQVVCSSKSTTETSPVSKAPQEESASSTPATSSRTPSTTTPSTTTSSSSGTRRSSSTTAAPTSVSLVKDKAYACPETDCDKTFRHTQSLKTHISIHKNHRPHVCSECGKRFLTASKLTVHQRTHSGVKPYPCPACPKAFRQRQHLSVHMRTHAENAT